MTSGERVTVRATSLTVEYRLRGSGGARGPAALRGLLQRSPVVRALTDVSLSLHAGETIGLVGGNGAGKSTLLRALTGLTPATAGTVEATTRPLLLSVGAAMIPELSGERNALLGALALGMDRDAARAAAREALDFAGLGEASARPLSTYSAGMAARLRFAVATITTQEILFVDEALSVGDAAFSQRARVRMSELSAQAGTVVLVSHAPAQLLESCTRGVWLHQGRIEADGPIRDVLDAYRDRPQP